MGGGPWPFSHEKDRSLEMAVSYKYGLSKWKGPPSYHHDLKSIYKK